LTDGDDAPIVLGGAAGDIADLVGKTKLAPSIMRLPGDPKAGSKPPITAPTKPSKMSSNFLAAA
jgi:hypothetical protein